jgi:Mn2+/Fe2+ NRAMP family transporter
MLVYLVVPFLVKQDLGAILKASIVPTFHWDASFLAILVGILGTTISPYLFFWQASVEVEELKQHKKHLMVNKKLIRAIDKDVDFGMGVSGIVMYFIILTAGSVLFPAGIHQIDTVEQAAQALKPLAGSAAYILFALGVIGTGLIAIPVLSGSLSFIAAETFGWELGLDKKFHEARSFYMIIALSLLVGLCMNYIGLSPVKALVYTAILYGLTAPVMIGIILHIANNRRIMGKFTNSRRDNVIGFLALGIMSAAALALLIFEFVV